MFNEKDLQQLAAKGISKELAEMQLASFAKGFPYLDIKQAASIGNGLLRLSLPDANAAIQAWDHYLAGSGKVVKFVPASGAASRMFKDLYEFLNGDHNEPASDFEKQFFAHIQYFAFFGDLNEMCLKNAGKVVTELMAEKRYKDVVANLLESKGLNYGSLPKGLLKFHRYPNEIRTPFLEHLVEGALYATVNGESHIHYTVSAEHRLLFEKHLKDSLAAYEERFGIKFIVSFS